MGHILNSLTEQNIISCIAAKSSATELDAAALQVIADQYPYFGAAQYLLAKKLYQAGDKSYQQQIQKGGLHFSNPLWLHFNLAQETGDFINDPAVFAKNNAEEKPSGISVDGTLEDITPEDENSITKTAGKPENETAAHKSPFLPAAEESIDFSLPDIDKDVDAEGGNVLPDSDEAYKEADKIPLEISNQPEENFEPEDIMPGDSNTEADSKIRGVLESQLADYEKPVDETASLVIEPRQYYRVDYFASQGIKLNKQEEGDNKLDAKVKRFTDWLKQMKRIGPQPVDLGTDTASEGRVQLSAENSNQTEEVVTEAMAEVLAKQGKIEKSIEIYEKLSFLNPDKSVYFASQIKELKGL